MEGFCGKFEKFPTGPTVEIWNPGGVEASQDIIRQMEGNDHSIKCQILYFGGAAF
jgi:hypothetical protein